MKPNFLFIFSLQKPHVAKARFLKPHINREKMQSITVRAGHLVKLDVDVKGEPAPTLQCKSTVKFSVYEKLCRKCEEIQKRNKKNSIRTSTTTN